MKALFCTDGSEISYNAIKNFTQWVIYDSVDILCVADWSFLPDNISLEDKEFMLKCSNSVDTILNYSKELLNELGINVDKKIKMCGQVVDSILELLENEKYMCIILGSNGKKGISKWLGAVSSKVATSSNIPVYISKNVKSANKIVFCIDNSEITKNNIKNNLNILNLADKEIYLLTVYEMPDFLFLEGNIDSNWINDIDSKQEKTATLLLNDYQKIFSNRGLNLNNKVILRGNPTKEIVNFNSRNQTDLIVCSSKNNNLTSNMLLSSVSKKIIEAVSSDILILKQ